MVVLLPERCNAAKSNNNNNMWNFEPSWRDGPWPSNNPCHGDVPGVPRVVEVVRRYFFVFVYGLTELSHWSYLNSHEQKELSEQIDPIIVGPLILSENRKISTRRSEPD